MEIHWFTRLQYESFVCVALDTNKWRYWYSISTPFYIEKIPMGLVNNKLRTEQEKKFEKQFHKQFGTKMLNLQTILQFICHYIHHVRCCLHNKFHDSYWKQNDPTKYSNITKWYIKLFSPYYFKKHQNQIIR